jgi:hypothetical protein
MIILAPGDTLRARLAAAADVLNPSFSFAYADDGAARTLGRNKGVLDDTNNVDLVGAPPANTFRVIRSGFICNRDDADVDVAIEQYDGTNADALASVTLKPGYTLQLGDDGFRVTDATGAEIDPASTPTPGDDSNRKIVAFAFGDASPLPILTVPNDCTDILARLVIDTPFDGAGAQLKLGTSGNPEALLAAVHNDPTQAAGYEAAPDVSLSAGQQILLTITPGAGATQGAGRVIFDAIAN